MEITAILLAGGKSSRMGRNKTLLPVRSVPAVAGIAAELQKKTDQLLLVTNEPKTYEFLGLPMVQDLFPGSGPLAGIHAGLSASRTEWNAAAACDMPFIRSEAVDDLLRMRDGFDAVVPEIGGRLQPLFALYRKNCTAALEVCLKEDRLKVRDFLDSISVYIMKEEEFHFYRENEEAFRLMFFNMNNQAEYKKAIALGKKLNRPEAWGK